MQNEVDAARMNPTADWERLGERYYRKVQLYTEVFDQDLELENHIVAGAPYGGAIGMSISAMFNYGDFTFLLLVLFAPLLSRPRRIFWLVACRLARHTSFIVY